MNFRGCAKRLRCTQLLSWCENKFCNDVVGLRIGQRLMPTSAYRTITNRPLCPAATNWKHPMPPFQPPAVEYVRLGDLEVKFVKTIQFPFLAPPLPLSVFLTGVDQSTGHWNPKWNM